MERYIPGEIYKNIEKLLEYRNINTSYKFLSTNDFAKEINHYGYIIITGSNTRKRASTQALTTYIILLSPGSSYALKSPEFRTLIKKKIPEDVLTNGVDILIISEYELSNHIEKVINDIIKEYPRTYIENYPYSKFIIEIPKHVSVPKHEFASEEEIDGLLRDFYKSQSYFPKIFRDDSAAIWLGARVGDVIKITRISETSGKSVAYRIVVK